MGFAPASVQDRLSAAMATRPWGRRSAALVTGVLVAGAVRALVGAPRPAASIPGAIIFAAMLAGLAVVTRGAMGQAPGVLRHWAPAVAVGAAGAVLLVAASLAGAPAVTLAWRAAPATLAWWAPLVVVVASCEEIVLRGTLFTALSLDHGAAVALAVTTVLFAVIHLPQYGVGALPLDLAVGLFLGGLRLLSGGVAAPLVAHTLADLATAALP